MVKSLLVIIFISFEANQRLWIKKCFYCNKGFVQNYGFINGVQRYKCSICNKQFVGGNQLNNAQIWEDYVKGKQTYEQLSRKYNCSKRTIQRRIDTFKVEEIAKEPRPIIVLMDTTYRGRNFGVVLFKDALSKENLLKYYFKNDTNALYI